MRSLRLIRLVRFVLCTARLRRSAARLWGTLHRRTLIVVCAVTGVLAVGFVLLAECDEANASFGSFASSLR